MTDRHGLPNSIFSLFDRVEPVDRSDSHCHKSWENQRLMPLSRRHWVLRVWFEKKWRLNHHTNLVQLLYSIVMQRLQSSPSVEKRSKISWLQDLFDLFSTDGLLWTLCITIEYDNWTRFVWWCKRHFFHLRLWDDEYSRVYMCFYFWGLVTSYRWIIAWPSDVCN